MEALYWTNFLQEPLLANSVSYFHTITLQLQQICLGDMGRNHLQNEGVKKFRNNSLGEGKKILILEWKLCYIVGVNFSGGQ